MNKIKWKSLCIAILMLTFVKSFKSNQLSIEEIDFNSGMIGSESDLQTISEHNNRLDLNHDKVKVNLKDYSNMFIREHSDVDKEDDERSDTLIKILVLIAAVVVVTPLVATLIYLIYKKIKQRQKELMIERLNIEHIDYSEVLEEAINNDESHHEDIKEVVINCIKTNENVIGLIDKMNEKKK